MRMENNAKDENGADRHKICRLCLYHGFEIEIISIFNNSIEDLSTKIKECVSLEVYNTDKIPSLICLTCLQQINQWSEFKDTCHRSQNILLQLNNNCLNDNPSLICETVIKNEITESEITKKDLYGNVHKNLVKYTENKNFDTVSSDIILENSNLSSTYKNDHELFENDPEKVNKNDEIIESIVQMPINAKENVSIAERNISYHNEEKSNFNNQKNVMESNSETIHILEKTKLDCNDMEIDDQSYNCHICKISFINLLEYFDHLETHDGQPIFKCEKCTKVFNCKKDLVEHDSRHQIPCPKCGKLILPSCMKVHLVLHTDRYKCSQCSTCFTNSSMLRKHVQTVHIRLKTHICETCGKSFTTPVLLQTHIKIHSDARPYACKICDYTAKTSPALNIHMSCHEDGTHVCEICAKSFKSLRSLRDHTRRVHTEVKKHECGICFKKFVDKYMLTVHTRIHTGAKPYQCSVCDEGFARSSGLRDHLATHGQNKIQ